MVLSVLCLRTLTELIMPRGKNTNVYLVCQNPKGKGKGKGKGDDKKCGMQNYKTRINKKTITGKLEHKKFCPKCNASTPHASGSEIKHSS